MRPICDIAQPSALIVVQEYRTAYQYLQADVLPAVRVAAEALRKTAAALCTPIAELLDAELVSDIPELPPLPPVFDVSSVNVTLPSPTVDAVLHNVRVCQNDTAATRATEVVDKVLHTIAIRTGPTATEVLLEAPTQCDAQQRQKKEVATTEPLEALRADLAALRAQIQIWQRALERLCEIQAALAVHGVTDRPCTTDPGPLLARLTRLDVGVLLLFFERPTFEAVLRAALSPAEFKALTALPVWEQYTTLSGATLSLQGQCERGGPAADAVTAVMPLLHTLIAAGWRGDGVEERFLQRQFVRRAERGNLQLSLTCAIAAAMDLTPAAACAAALRDGMAVPEGHITSAEFRALWVTLDGSDNDASLPASDVRCLQLAARFDASDDVTNNQAARRLETAMRLMPPRLLIYWMLATTPFVSL
jgi:hypothetical protein